VRHLVTALEQCIVNLLSDYDIQAYAKPDAPGVYIDEKKICSVGLRIRKGCSFHGLALNVNMDLEPFQRINPCGYAGLEMVDCATVGGPSSLSEAAQPLVDHFCQLAGITTKELREGFDE
jgi:lipoyl(octanoyl) transferase